MGSAIRMPIYFPNWKLIRARLVSGWALTILAEEKHAENTAGRGLFL